MAYLKPESGDARRKRLYRSRQRLKVGAHAARAEQLHAHLKIFVAPPGKAWVVPVNRLAVVKAHRPRDILQARCGQARNRKRVVRPHHNEPALPVGHLEHGLGRYA